MNIRKILLKISKAKDLSSSMHILPWTPNTTVRFQECQELGCSQNNSMLTSKQLIFFKRNQRINVSIQIQLCDDDDYISLLKRLLFEFRYNYVGEHNLCRNPSASGRLWYIPDIFLAICFDILPIFNLCNL